MDKLINSRAQRFYPSVDRLAMTTNCYHKMWSSVHCPEDYFCSKISQKSVNFF